MKTVLSEQELGRMLPEQRDLLPNPMELRYTHQGQVMRRRVHWVGIGFVTRDDPVDGTEPCLIYEGDAPNMLSDAELEADIARNLLREGHCADCGATTRDEATALAHASLQGFACDEFRERETT